MSTQKQCQIHEANCPDFPPGANISTASVKSFIAVILSGFVGLLIVSRNVIDASFGILSSDLPDHFRLLTTLKDSGWFFYSTWYYLEQLFVLGSKNETTFFASALVLLASLYMAKSMIFTRIQQEFGATPIESFILGLALSFAIALPSLNTINQLGTISPNVFHSSTQVLAITTGVLAIVATSVFVSSGGQLAGFALIGFSILSATAKPALTLPILTTHSLILFYFLRQDKFQFCRRIRILSVVIFSELAIMLLGYYFSYTSSSWNPNLVVIDPFLGWDKISGNILIDLLRSLVFPIAGLILLFPILKCKSISTFVIPAWITLFVALVQLTLFAEVSKVDGSVFGAGNFVWGPMIANAGLFTITVIACRHLELTRKLMAYSFLALHSLTGLVFLYVWHMSPRI